MKMPAKTHNETGYLVVGDFQRFGCEEFVY